MQRSKDIGLPWNSILYIVIPDLFATVIPRNDSDEESCRKDFSLPLEMTVWTGFERLFELPSAKIPSRRHKLLFTNPSFLFITAVSAPVFFTEKYERKFGKQAECAGFPGRLNHFKI